MKIFCLKLEEKIKELSLKLKNKKKEEKGIFKLIAQTLLKITNKNQDYIRVFSEVVRSLLSGNDLIKLDFEFFDSLKEFEIYENFLEKFQQSFSDIFKNKEDFVQQAKIAQNYWKNEKNNLEQSLIKISSLLKETQNLAGKENNLKLESLLNEFQSCKAVIEDNAGVLRESAQSLIHEYSLFTEKNSKMSLNDSKMSLSFLPSENLELNILNSPRNTNENSQSKKKKLNSTFKIFDVGESICLSVSKPKFDLETYPENGIENLENVFLDAQLKERCGNIENKRIGITIEKMKNRIFNTKENLKKLREEEKILKDSLESVFEELAGKLKS